jgi:hypothetical protein
MNMARLFLVELGVFPLIFGCLLGRQILRRELVSMKQRGRVLGSAEGVVLFAIATITGTRYCLELLRTARHGPLPELGIGWIAVFATSCAIYLGTKAVRVLRIQSK